MDNIKQELDKIKIRISDPNFLTNKGLSNEVGIHVFCYDPADELIVRDYIERLVTMTSVGFRVIERDMYKIFLEILSDMGVLDDVAKMEEENGKEFMLDELQQIADVKAFLEKMQYEPHEHGKDVLFLTGVGKVYPFMRSHIMLNAMQKMFADIPVLMFYPGSFNGQDLILFEKFHDGNYYRAFNLL
jgi:hypothetical protein